MPSFAELAADSYGSSDRDAPLVLLHGLTFDRSHWGPTLGELVQLDPDRRAVAFDLPGHGDSPRRDSYRLTDVAPVLHAAITEAGLAAPVLVGHSLGGALATHYAANYPARAVINVDQPLQVAGFAELLRQSESRLRGPEWTGFWAMLSSGMHAELLPPGTRDLVESAQPRQDQLLGYWQELLETPIPELDEQRTTELTTIAAKRIPYHYVTGAEVPAPYQDWLTALVPDVAITVLPGTGHFPHLGRPAAFARLLNSIR
jgi:pimeloyl-ACP methyl ester carboxylesterase